MWIVKRTNGYVTEWLMQDTEKFRSMQSEGINIPLFLGKREAEHEAQRYERISPEWTYTIEEYLR